MIAPSNAPDGKKTQGLIATASDDGQIIVYNQSSHRLEGILNPQLGAGKKDPEQKICKFLHGSNVIVGADSHGYLNFWAITHTPHPWKNKLLTRRKYVNDEEKIQKESGQKTYKYQPNKAAGNQDEEEEQYEQPIRGIDYDPVERMLYCGDEMGYMLKLDVSKLLDKVDMICEEARVSKASMSPDKQDDGTFNLTATN